MISTLVFVLAFGVVAVLVYVAKYSGRVRVEQTRLIAAPLAQVFAQVADFRHWQQWNPWLAHAPTAPLKLSAPSDAPGSCCAWDIAEVGEGEVEHIRLEVPHRITQRMRLKHPFTVKGIGEWTFAERNGMTEVRWRMDGAVAFSLRAFAGTVQGSMALDLRYGLDQLASRVEAPDAPRYALTYTGTRAVDAVRYVYRTYQGTLKGLVAARQKMVAELVALLQQRGIPALGAPFAVYVKTNIKLRTTVCHFGIPIGDADAGELPARELPAYQAWVARLDGDPNQLELAWYLAMQHMFLAKVQPDQRIAPSEHYDQRVTELRIPMRVVPLQV
jgi:uncharacterized protein YndB with AHSA1/START domain